MFKQYIYGDYIFLFLLKRDYIFHGEFIRDLLLYIGHLKIHHTFFLGLTYTITVNIYISNI